MVKNPLANKGGLRDKDSIPGFGKIPWRKSWQPTPVFLPGESHGQRSMVGYSPWSYKESDTTEATCTNKGAWLFLGVLRSFSSKRGKD